MGRVDKLFGIEGFVSKDKGKEEEGKDDKWENLWIRDIGINEEEEEEKNGGIIRGL